MTHPEELLAGYVDGTLSAKDRVAVEAHLAACSRCSREVELARWSPDGAAVADGGPGPSGCRLEGPRGSDRGPARGRRDPPLVPVRGHRRGGRRRTVGVHAGPAPHRQRRRNHVRSLAREGPGGGRGRSRGSSAGGGERDRDPPRELRRRLVDRLDLVVSEPNPGASGAGAAAAPVAPAFGTQAQTDEALACMRRSRLPIKAASSRPSSGRDSRARPPTWRCSSEGPGAGQPADTVTVWVFAHDGLQDPSFSSAQL